MQLSDQRLLAAMAGDIEIKGLHHIKWAKIQILATETQRTQRYLSPQMNTDFFIVRLPLHGPTQINANISCTSSLPLVEIRSSSLFIGLCAAAFKQCPTSCNALLTPTFVTALRRSDINSICVYLRLFADKYSLCGQGGINSVPRGSRS